MNVFLLLFIYMSCIIDLFMLMLQLLTIISSIDDLNYPEKTHTYFIVNAPYIFSACWKVSYYCYQKNKKRCCSLWLGFCMMFLFNIALESVWRPQQDVNTIHLTGCEATFTREDKKKSAGLIRMRTRGVVKCKIFVFVFLLCFLEQDFLCISSQ
jgi:hypothetical protein